MEDKKVYLMKNLELHINNLITKTSQSLLVSGVSTNNFSCSIEIPANIPNNDLIIIGNTTPLWFIKLEIISKKYKNVLVVIDKLDSIPSNEQLKFLSIIKYKSISGFHLPNNAHVIITYNDIEKIDNRIKSNCFVVKAD